MFVARKELVNAYVELNDPFEQLERFKTQARVSSCPAVSVGVLVSTWCLRRCVRTQDRLAGDEEACEADTEFCHALRYGLPPTGGWGMGLDRLVMMLTNRSSIRVRESSPLFRPAHTC